MVLVEGDPERSGFAKAPSQRSRDPQLVASATLDALRQPDPAADAVHVVARTSPVSGRLALRS